MLKRLNKMLQSFVFEDKFNFAFAQLFDEIH